MTVIVLADRGLYAHWLFVVSAPGRGTRWQGTGTAVKTGPLHCTLLACSGLRAWIEHGCKLTNRGAGSGSVRA